MEVASRAESRLPAKIRREVEAVPDFRAVLIRWPEDVDRDERETYVWSLLKPNDWCGKRHLAWRYAPCELAKLRAMHGGRK